MLALFASSSLPSLPISAISSNTAKQMPHFRTTPSVLIGSLAIVEQSRWRSLVVSMMFTSSWKIGPVGSCPIHVQGMGCRLNGRADEVLKKP